MRLAVLAVLSALLAAPAASAQTANAPGRYAPRDECASQLGAAAFRAALADAVRRRNANAFVALAAKDVSLSFGGDSGTVELRRLLTGAGNEQHWRRIAALLALGCAVTQGGEIVMPWFFNQDLGELDPFEVRLAAGANVPMRAGASASARNVRVLSWQLVRPVGEFDPSRSFQQVQLIGARQTGYVATAALLSPIGLRLYAKRISGRWRITALLEGD